MDLLEALGLSRPVAECTTCLELYFDDVAGAEALLERKEQCMRLLQPYLSSYLWQHEPLRLQSSEQQQPPWVLRNQGARRRQQQQQQQQPPSLWGVVRYEDCVDDEWFVVWLLLHLTQQLPGLTARCWDDDGEFLLIEAAYSLPRWLKPESSTNRVWLRGGQLHIIPPPSSTHPTLPATPSVTEALAVLRSGSVATRRRRVEAAVHQRLSGYPSKASQQLQRTTAWLPRRLALLLAADPQLVAGAVAAFMTRQRDEVQAASRLRLFAPTDMTTARVTLNRCMYAQLSQADFAPPKGYPTPPGGNWLGGEAARQHKAVSMGVKITTGMELMSLRLGLQPQAPPATAAVGGVGGVGGIGGVGAGAGAAAAAGGSGGVGLASAAAEGAAVGSRAGASESEQPQQLPQHQSHPQQQEQEQQQQQSLSGNPAWHSYTAVLQRSGYFDGELEGSARHRQLLAAAQAAFTSSDAYAASTAALAAPKQHLLQLLAAVEAQAAAGGGDSSSNRSSSRSHEQQQWQQLLAPVAAVLDVDKLESCPAEDGDEWMSAEAEELQQRLAQAEMQAAAHSTRRQHQQQPQDAAGAAAAGAGAAGGPDVDPGHLISGFRGFVQHMAGVEGAEVPTAGPAAAAAAAAGVAGTAASSSGSGQKRGSNNGSSASKASTATQQQQQQQQQHGKRKMQRRQQQGQHEQQQFGGEDGLEFDPNAFLSELLGVLGAAAEPLQQQQQSPAAAAAALHKAQQLQQQLEQRLARFEAAAAAEGEGGGSRHAGDAADSDDYRDSEGSSEEGSSFYGSSSGSESGEAEENEFGPLGQNLLGFEGAGRVQQQRRGPGAGHVSSGTAAAGAAGAAAGALGSSQRAAEPVLLQVPPPVSQRRAAGQQQQQQQRSGQLEGGQQQGQQQGQRQPQTQRWQQWACHDEAREVMTATDSDDDEDALSIGGSSGSEGGSVNGEEAGTKGAGAAAGDGFYDSYAAAMEAELAATTLGQTFERLSATPAAGAAGGAGFHAHTSQPAGSTTSGATAATAAAAAGVSADAGLTPVDVDFNLIKSLVASFAAQGGLPGPASNLAGLLGLQLPTEVELQEQEVQQQQRRPPQRQ